jgi:short-subunit dehydrogenase
LKFIKERIFPIKIAVVTGASSGIGKEYVRLLAKEGAVDEIWALARREERLSGLAEEFAFPVRAIRADVSSRESVAKYRKLLEAEQPDVRILINNAGYGRFGSFEAIGAEDSACMIETNCCGPVLMTFATLPYMKAGSRILNTCSLSAFQPLPYMNIYASSKVFLLSHTRALRRELAPRGISVTCACPGWVKTNFLNLAHRVEPATITKYNELVTPEQVARHALADAEKGREVSVFPGSAKWMRLAGKLLPHNFIIWYWMKWQGLGKYAKKQ